MRRIDAELQARLNSGATTLCRCWRVRRRDGRAYGFTDHDNDLLFDGNRFKASTGLNATAVQATTGLAVDNAQVMGALSDAGLQEADILAGRFDRAQVEQWLVDWRRPDLRVLMFVGRFGEIRRTEGAFEVELRGLTEELNVPVGRRMQRSCDRRLGDDRCGFNVNLPGFSGEAEVQTILSASSVTSAGLSGFTAGWFAAGALEWLTGANAGERSSVKEDASGEGASRRIELWREPGARIAAGDRFRVIAGCDKRMETCREKFSNILNFRGFPHIPGDDWVAAYPKNGQVHDGSSLRNR